MTDVLIKRELLERVCARPWMYSEKHKDALRELQAILAAPRQPEGEGLEVVAWVVTGISSERARSTLGRTRRAFLVSQHDADQQHANWLPHYQSVTTDELCRLSDAQRAIAELREQIDDLELHLASTEDDLENARRNASAFENRMGELQVENGKLQAERDTLRQQLAERDAEIDNLKERLSNRAAEHCDDLADKIELEVQRDKLAGLLGEVISKRKRLTLDEVKRIDAALAEVEKK